MKAGEIYNIVRENLHDPQKLARVFSGIRITKTELGIFQAIYCFPEDAWILQLIREHAILE